MKQGKVLLIISLFITQIITYLYKKDEFPIVFKKTCVIIRTVPYAEPGTFGPVPAFAGIRVPLTRKEQTSQYERLKIFHI